MRSRSILLGMLITLSVSFMVSCSFDNRFLKPTILNREAKQISYKTRTDSIFVRFDGENKQPNFKVNGIDKPETGYSIESVFFDSNSGNSLNGWMLKPENNANGITLLHFHGNAGCLLSQFKLMLPLVMKGYNVFIFDYSGFGFSSGKALRKNVLKDGFSSLDYLLSREDVKNTQVLIYGQSYGGHLSAIVATQRQSEIAGLIMEGAFSSHKEIASEFVGFNVKPLIKEELPAYKAIRDVTIPVLVIHSSEDEIIPLRMGKKLYENANSPKEFFQIEHPHLYGPTYYADELATKIEGMLK